jgi:hypothetical protein
MIYFTKFQLLTEEDTAAFVRKSIKEENAKIIILSK